MDRGGGAEQLLLPDHLPDLQMQRDDLLADLGDLDGEGVGPDGGRGQARRGQPRPGR